MTNFTKIELQNVDKTETVEKTEQVKTEKSTYDLYLELKEKYKDDPNFHDFSIGV
jgi:hypothetical protein